MTSPELIEQMRTQAECWETSYHTKDAVIVDLGQHYFSMCLTER